MEQRRSKISLEVERSISPDSTQYEPRPLQYTELLNADGSRRAFYAGGYGALVEDLRPTFLVATFISTADQRQLAAHNVGLTGIVSVDAPGLTARTVATHDFAPYGAETFRFVRHDGEVSNLLVPAASKAYYELGRTFGDERLVRIALHNLHQAQSPIDLLVSMGELGENPHSAEEIAPTAARVTKKAIERGYYSYFAHPEWRKERDPNPPQLSIGPGSSLLFMKDVPQFTLGVTRSFIPGLSAESSDFGYYPKQHARFNALAAHYRMNPGMVYVAYEHRDAESKEKVDELLGRYPKLNEIKPGFLSTTYLIGNDGKLVKLSDIPTSMVGDRKVILSSRADIISLNTASGKLERIPSLPRALVESEFNIGEVTSVANDLALIEERLSLR